MPSRRSFISSFLFFEAERQPCMLAIMRANKAVLKCLFFKLLRPSLHHHAKDAFIPLDSASANSDL
jgi:hypothetical protein